MSGITVYEFEWVYPSGKGDCGTKEIPAVPTTVFDWLQLQCLRSSVQGETAWLRLGLRRGRVAIQFTNYVGVIRAPDGFQIEVLPKVGLAIGGGEVESRCLLIEMLRCLNGFRHIRTDSANLAAARMPLLEVFISEFLQAVARIVKHGLRGDYTAQQDNLFTLRGKLLVIQNLRQNLCRADRFYTEHDVFSTNRPENRLVHTALRCVLSISTFQSNQQLARELCFVFADVPESSQIANDFQRVRLDRGMAYYADSLAWARLILEDESPLTGSGKHSAPSLLFPMESVFEAFVAKHLARQLVSPLTLKLQAQSHHLVRHKEQNWFRLKPDLLVQELANDRIVLDTKWKLIDGIKANGTDKYGLSQSDFYQLYAYGQSYLSGEGDVVLIYPKTDNFKVALDVFDFPKATGLRLWVLPFCLKTKVLLVPANAPFAADLRSGTEATHSSVKFNVARVQ